MHVQPLRFPPSFLVYLGLSKHASRISGLAKMSSVQNPTYLLAPNWTYRPHMITLGTIVADPFRPHRSLSKPSPAVPSSAIETVTENNWRLSVETARGLTLSVWAQFLQNINVKLAAAREKVKAGHFTMDNLETNYLTDDPEIEEIAKRCSEQKVKDYMTRGLLSKPVYMVTGVKIAKGFSLQGSASVTHEFSGEVASSVTPETSVGFGGGVTSRETVEDGFESTGDIVFAYQLLRIKPKGWGKDKTYGATDYQPAAALLATEDDSDESVAVEVESDLVTAAELKILREGIQTKKVEATESSNAEVVFERTDV
jgi:hypothetical protein